MEEVDDETSFLAAASLSKSFSNLDTEQQLELYGLFKQGTCGDVDTSKPFFFDMVGVAKWDAWKVME